MGNLTDGMFCLHRGAGGEHATRVTAVLRDGVRGAGDQHRGHSRGVHRDGRHRRNRYDRYGRRRVFNHGLGPRHRRINRGGHLNRPLRGLLRSPGERVRRGAGVDDHARAQDATRAHDHGRQHHGVRHHHHHLGKYTVAVHLEVFQQIRVFDHRDDRVVVFVERVVSPRGARGVWSAWR